MVLNDQELCVISTKAMRYTTDEALVYLKLQGYKMEKSNYYKILGHISSETRKNAFEIAKSFLEDHINTVHELESIKNQMYQQVVLADKPADKVMILAKITETMIPYISAYREATKEIISKVKKEIGSQKENLNLSFT